MIYRKILKISIEEEEEVTYNDRTQKYLGTKTIPTTVNIQNYEYNPFKRIPYYLMETVSTHHVAEANQVHSN